MKNYTTSVFIIALCAAHGAHAQTHTSDAQKSAEQLSAEAKNGVELTAKTVQGSVGVTAVLLTQGSVRRLFGTEIANTYAVVELTISNKNPDSAFVLHSAYIDTSQWALGGGTHGFMASAGGPTNRTGTTANQISSAEARIARGQLLDAQQWSARNWTTRLLTLAGSLASGYSFSFSEVGIAKGIAAFNGTFVPGVATAWPDGAAAQLNRISDFGYQTNKVIGKDLADVVVCLFPIDMFLSTPFRGVFLKSPGLFLSPYQILFTPANEQLRTSLGLEPFVKKMQELHPCYSKSFEPPLESKTPLPALLAAREKSIETSCAAKLSDSRNADIIELLDYLGRFGVQNIGVYVDGIMTVDIDIVPASIDQITFNGDPSKPAFWAATGNKSGTIQCRFCKGGQITIAEADSLGIRDLKTTDGADDNHLNFSFTTTKAIETGQTLTFGIVKKSSDPKKASQEVKSAPFTFTVGYSAAAPTVTAVSISEGKATVTGTGFLNTKTNALAALLHDESGKDKDVPVSASANAVGDSLTFDVPAGVPPGCWSVHVKIGTMETSGPKNAKSEVLSPAAPTVAGATRSGDTVVVKGTQLVDTSACGGMALNFQLQSGSKAPVDVKSKLVSDSEATFPLPADAKKGAWTVRLLQGSTVAATAPLK